MWSYQVENMEREIEDGGGFIGGELDDLAGSPGGLPFSYLIAGWISSAPTPAAEAAAGIMGVQPWDQAPSLVYPTAVLTLFIADAVASADGPETTAMASARLASLAQGGICSTLANWVNDALNSLFDLLKVHTDDDGFLGWIATIWNAAVDLARAVVTGLVELLTAPIVAVIANALAVIGTLNMVASLLKPWSVKVTPSSTDTRFSVGAESDIAEVFEAEVDTNIDFSWPSYIEDCASVAGLDLPDPRSAKGSTVAWVTDGLPDLGAFTGTQTVIGEDNKATLEWVTGNEDSNIGELQAGTVTSKVSVISKQIEELKAMLANLIGGQIPVSPFGEFVASMFSNLTAPIFDAIAELTHVSGIASVTVTYHDQEENKDVVTESSACVLGTWSVVGDDVANIHGSKLGEVAEEVFAEGSVIAEFKDDGTVTYTFNGWKYGNTTYTESALPGVISDLSGEVSIESNGTARGTWSVDGETLVLLVGNFDTSVVQSIISYELEFDSQIDAIPDLARVYLIPNGATAHICDENQLTVEWADGLGVRWSRTG
jgi:nitrate reductase NapAB chaperone NapD